MTRLVAYDERMEREVDNQWYPSRRNRQRNMLVELVVDKSIDNKIECKAKVVGRKSKTGPTTAVSRKLLSLAVA